MKPQKPVVYHCEMARSTGGYLVDASTANVALFSKGSGCSTLWFPALNKGGWVSAVRDLFNSFLCPYGGLMERVMPY